MREHIRKLVLNARRATWTDPAERPTSPPLDRAATAHPPSLAADAIRMARLAAMVHMDQAAGLRAYMSAAAQPSAPAPGSMEMNA